ncbi:hypothetical protein R84B8_00305 [Treponema sp. R8-4-B8]
MLLYLYDSYGTINQTRRQLYGNNDCILGTNVINNWEMIISKKEHTFQFRENPPDSIPNKMNIYQNYFNKEGNYIYVQDN